MINPCLWCPGSRGSIQCAGAGRDSKRDAKVGRWSGFSRIYVNASQSFVCKDEAGQMVQSVWLPVVPGTALGESCLGNVFAQVGRGR